jgi:hypothetical protein
MSSLKKDHYSALTPVQEHTNHSIFLNGQKPAKNSLFYLLLTFISSDSKKTPIN